MDEYIREKMNTWLYRLTKNAANWSYKEFLKGCDISDDEYEKIKLELDKLGLKTYV